MTVFPDSAAPAYDEHCIARVPGYELVQDMVVSLAQTLIPDDSKILLSGCGTGNELLRLALANNTWTFTAVEPSPGMLSKAKEKTNQADCADRVCFINERLDGAPAGLHSGAVSLLVCHFIKGGHAKLAYLKDLASRLKVNAPVFICDFTLDYFETMTNKAYITWMLSQGLPAGEAQAVISRINKNWDPISMERFQSLLDQSGFIKQYVFFRAMNYQGIMARKG